MDFLRHGRRYICPLALAAAAVTAGCASKPFTPPAVMAPATRPTTAFAASLPVLEPPTPATRPAAVPLGTSTEGRPITLHTFGDPAAARETVLIFGGIHGNEPTSAGVCRELLAHLTANPALCEGRCVAVIAEANPDGLLRRLRTNARLIDVNRNFPAANWKKTRRTSFFGGDAPATEPESKALIAAIERLKPARVVAVHSMDDPCNNYDGPGEALAKLMAATNGYPVKASIGYPTPGSFGSWAGGDRKIPVITLELPNKGTTKASWEKNREALAAFIRGE
ncbi:MAG TPA: M14 family murein peptide amidase A [Humisphaera sp.]